MLDKENGVSMTLMFRVVQKVIAVKPTTDAVVDGKVGGEGTKKKKDGCSSEPFGEQNWAAHRL